MFLCLHRPPRVRGRRIDGTARQDPAAGGAAAARRRAGRAQALSTTSWRGCWPRIRTVDGRRGAVLAASALPPVEEIDASDGGVGDAATGPPGHHRQRAPDRLVVIAGPHAAAERRWSGRGHRGAVRAIDEEVARTPELRSLSEIEEELARGYGARDASAPRRFVVVTLPEPERPPINGDGGPFGDCHAGRAARRAVGGLHRPGAILGLVGGRGGDRQRHAPPAGDGRRA